MAFCNAAPTAEMRVPKKCKFQHPLQTFYFCFYQLFMKPFSMAHLKESPNFFCTVYKIRSANLDASNLLDEKGFIDYCLIQYFGKLFGEIVFKPNEMRGWLLKVAFIVCFKTTHFMDFLTVY